MKHLSTFCKRIFEIPSFPGFTRDSRLLFRVLYLESQLNYEEYRQLSGVGCRNLKQCYVKL